MVQAGDPTGTGKGGECIWGGLMEDEFHPSLKVRRRPCRDLLISRFPIVYDQCKHVLNVLKIEGELLVVEVKWAERARG